MNILKKIILPSSADYLPNVAFGAAMAEAEQTLTGMHKFDVCRELFNQMEKSSEEIDISGLQTVQVKASSTLRRHAYAVKERNTPFTLAPKFGQEVEKSPNAAERLIHTAHIEDSYLLPNIENKTLKKPQKKDKHAKIILNLNKNTCVKKCKSNKLCEETIDTLKSKKQKLKREKKDTFKSTKEKHSLKLLTPKKKKSSNKNMIETKPKNVEYFPNLRRYSDTDNESMKYIISNMGGHKASNEKGYEYMLKEVGAEAFQLGDITTAERCKKKVQKQKKTTDSGDKLYKHKSRVNLNLPYEMKANLQANYSGKTLKKKKKLATAKEDIFNTHSNFTTTPKRTKKKSDNYTLKALNNDGTNYIETGEKCKDELILHKANTKEKLKRENTKQKLSTGEEHSNTELREGRSRKKKQKQKSCLGYLSFNEGNENYKQCESIEILKSSMEHKSFALEEGIPKSGSMEQEKIEESTAMQENIQNEGVDHTGTEIYEMQQDNSRKYGTKRRTNRNITNFCCEFCAYQTKINKDFITHVTNEHGVEYPGILNPSPETDINSFNKRAPPRARNFKCSYCHMRFTCRYNLDIHERKHTGKPLPVNCSQSYCSKTFATPAAARNHTISAHSGEREHACEYCGKSFALIYGLQTHLQWCNKRNTLFTCSKCGKQFRMQWKYSNHVASNKCKKAIFPCKLPQCQKRFVDSYKMHRHMTSVHKIANNDAIQEQDDEVIVTVY